MVFNKAVPGLKVSDINDALEFYQVKLGFDCLYRNDAFARLSINEVELHLWVQPERVGKTNSDGQKICIFADAYCWVQVSDLHAIYKAYQFTGAIDATNTKITRQPWGQIDFTVLDLYGNAIVFYEEAKKED